MTATWKRRPYSSSAVALPIPLVPPGMRAVGILSALLSVAGAPEQWPRLIRMIGVVVDGLTRR